ncbi:MnhB domain-containing protein [Monashia sp. NPDC004114]
MTEREAREQAASEPHTRAGWHRPVVGGVLVTAVAVVLVIGMVGLPPVNAPLPQIARHAIDVALPQWGQVEVVSEIVYGTRGFDTFGETFLLLAAVVAVTTLTRPREPRAEYVGEASAGRRSQEALDPNEATDSAEQQARSAEREEESEDSRPAAENADTEPLGTPAPERAVAMTVVVRVAVRVAAVLLAVASVYMAAWGYTPGGGFPAGAAVMGVVLLLYTGLGHRAVRRVVRPSVIEPVELAGAVAIVVIGVLGLVRQGSLFANFLPLAEPMTIRAGGTNQLYSGAELVEVATGLTIAVFGLLGMGRDWLVHDSDNGGAS